MDTQRDIINHRPTPEAAALMDELAASLISYLEVVEANCPNSREKSLAVTNAEQSIMWARASIARDSWEQQGRP